MSTKLDFGLWHSGRRHIVPTFAKDDEIIEEFSQRRQETLEHTNAVSELSATGREIDTNIHETAWAAEYATYFTKRIHRSNRILIEVWEPSDINFPDMSRLTLGGDDTGTTSNHSNFDDLPYDVHMRILETRRKEYQIMLAWTWDFVKALTRELTCSEFLVMCRISCQTIIVKAIDGLPEDDVIAFRLFDHSSKASFFSRTGDFRCANWRNFKIEQPRLRQSAKNHTKGEDAELTDYISVSTSPRRIPNFTRYNANTRQRTIAAIDLRVLRRLGIAYSSTWDDLNLRCDYATQHHLLVLGWIPRESILGFLSPHQFHTVLGQSGISTESKLSSWTFARNWT